VWHLAVLLGPLRALNYLSQHGVLAATLGAVWSKRLGWGWGVAAGAAVRVTGTLASLAVSSWTLNENLFGLLLNNVYSLLVSLGGQREIVALQFVR
jgi:hypothetical protein